MKTLFSLLFLILLSGSTSAQWNKDGKRVDDEPHRKAVKGFGAHLLVVQNPREFIEMWKKPETPEIASVKKVGFDVSLGVLLLFAGCKQDKLGVCNTEVDYTIYKPDGSILVERKNQPLWKELAPPRGNTQLGRAILVFRTAKSLPSGTYKVKANVSDLTADISFDLVTQYELK